jgi:hypothetical protein
MPRLVAPSCRAAAAILAALLCGAGAATIVSAQTSTPAKKQAPAATIPPGDDRVFLDAIRSTGEGRAEAALAAADATLAKDPKNRDATVSRIALRLASGDPAKALDAYDAWAGAVAREDVGLLARIAKATLTQFDKVPASELRGRALEARVRAGDATARKTLEERRKVTLPTSDTWEATLALARLGDVTAVAEVTAASREGVGSARVTGLQALRGLPAGRQVSDALMDALVTGDDVVKDTAAGVAMDVPSPDLVPTLRQVAQTGRFAAPIRAAAAMMRAGDMSERARVDAALDSPLPDAKVLAAQAYVGSAQSGWIPKLEPVLRDENVLLRVLAAELLLPVRRDAAMAVLGTVLDDPNPVLRAEAMRVLGGDPRAPLALLRAGLRDEAPWPRLYAARAIAARATAPSPAAAPSAKRPAPKRR